jgi:hypothetical protein
MAKNADDDFVERCPQLKGCDPELEPLQTRARTLAVATDVLLVSGGIEVLSGLAWWYFSSEPRRGKLRAAAAVTPQGAELRLQSGF